MKPILLLLAASVWLGATGANAQDDACSKKYGSCMDHCATRPASIQDTCANTCQSQSNQCYEGMWGPAEQPSAVNVQPAGSANAKASNADASAAKDSKPK